MKTNQSYKSWLLAGLLALLLSACATTQDTMPEDGSGTDGQVLDGSGDGSSAIGDGSDGADASSLDGSDSGDGTAIVDGSDGMGMSAMAMLEKTEGDLANRVVYFEYDSAKLTSESIALLETHGNFIAGNGEVSVRLEGHADERGSREYNIALGDRRAQSVRRVLLFQGASDDQLETVSYGEEKPAVAGQDEESWAKNRRVELVYKVN